MLGLGMLIGAPPPCFSYRCSLSECLGFWSESLMVTRWIASTHP
jgi:hypothetical protein